jgi:hypothetical protein
MATKDKDSGDKIGEDGTFYVSADFEFAPEPTYEITEYEHICLEAEAENLSKLQCYLIANKLMTLEDVHSLQDTKIEVLAEGLIAYQDKEYKELLDDNNAMEDQQEELVKKYRDLKEKFISMTTLQELNDWQNHTKLEDEAAKVNLWMKLKGEQPKFSVWERRSPKFSVVKDEDDL